MSFYVKQGDITCFKGDAIINAANRSLLGGGGVDGAIHRAAGKGLKMECLKLGGCKTGEAKITNGYDLSVKYIIHTVGPVWYGGNKHEQELLESCYYNSLELAVKYGCRSVAFPLISTGIFRYPKDQAIRVASNVISRFLSKHEMDVFLILFDDDTYDLAYSILANC